jgi:IPT/TIG domain
MVRIWDTVRDRKNNAQLNSCLLLIATFSQNVSFHILGDMMTGCGEGMFMPDVETEDKINLLIRGHYYGHPNQKRAIVDQDPRQCTWYNPSVPNDNYTSPLILMPSSTDGILEYRADYFDGQLRGNLITSKYSGGLYRVILTPDGRSVIPQSNPPIALKIGMQGLSVAQAPDGTLIETRLVSNSLYYHKPIENNPVYNATLRVNAVFPHRGSRSGGYRLTLYGRNFDTTVAATVGGQICSVFRETISPIRFQCLLPAGNGGTVDIAVQGTAGNYTFARGFRYVAGPAASQRP